MTLAAVDVCHSCYLGDHDLCTAPEDCGCARVDHAPPADARDRYCAPCLRTFATPQGLAVHRARSSAHDHDEPTPERVAGRWVTLPGPITPDDLPADDEDSEPPLALVAVPDEEPEDPPGPEPDPALHYIAQGPTFAGHTGPVQLPWAGTTGTEGLRRDLWKRYVEILLDLADALPDDALFDRIEWALGLTGP